MRKSVAGSFCRLCGNDGSGMSKNAIVKRLKALAKEHNVIFLVLSSFPKSTDDRSYHSPLLSDLIQMGGQTLLTM